MAAQHLVRLGHSQLQVSEVAAHLANDSTGTDQKNKTRSKESDILTVSAGNTEDAFQLLQSNTDGITDEEASYRLKVNGANILSTTKPQTWWQLLCRVIFLNPFNILLACLAIISIATPEPEWLTFVILLIMIVISCVVRFWQEYKSSVAAFKLTSSIPTEILVRRVPSKNGDRKPYERLIDTAKIVRGDIVKLSPGDSVPADCMLFGGSSLQIGQSSLTGESEPQHKSGRSSPGMAQKAIFDTPNIAFMGTSVISGTGFGLVIGTGDDTVLASITEELNKQRPRSAFECGILHVSYMMIAFMLSMVVTVFVINGTITKAWGKAALFALSVAVGQVPEMLPAIVNANLARGAFLLSRKKAIVKSLPSVQNLGSMTVLCSDKTGTLTKDETSLCHYEDCHGEESAHILDLAYTNAINQSGKGSSIDIAIISKTEADQNSAVNLLGEKVAEIPFDFERRRSSTVIKHASESTLLICKGAIEEIMEQCSRFRTRNGSPARLDNLWRLLLLNRTHCLNDAGYRVLGVATRSLRDADLNATPLQALESTMTLEGILTFADPPKEDAFCSIASLQKLGVECKVLTGDNLRVATKVCRTLKLSSKPSDPECGALRTITGPRLAQLCPPEFKEEVRICNVFAKLTPSQKGEVVICLQGMGHVVGMLGDGINDCIALRSADVGISIDTAVPVAKDCADVILTEKSLSIIVSGVETGRLTHGNTIKYIKMVASSNFGNVFSILIASAWLPFQPMTSLQMLLQNLLYDISQIALPWDRMDEEYIKVPQKWDTKDLLRFILILGPTSSIIDVLTFILGRFFYNIHEEADVYGVQLFHTHWFLQGLLTQTIIVHLLRTAKLPFLQSRASTPLTVSTIIIMSIGLAIPYIAPFAKALDLVKPANSFLGFLAAELFLYCLIVQVVKVAYIRIFKRWL